MSNNYFKKRDIGPFYCFPYSKGFSLKGYGEILYNLKKNIFPIFPLAKQQWGGRLRVENSLKLRDVIYGRQLRSISEKYYNLSDYQKTYILPTKDKKLKRMASARRPTKLNQKLFGLRVK